MQIDTALRTKIIRNALLSLFIYALPIVLMLLTFYIRGERPWLKQAGKQAKSVTLSR